MRLLEVTTGYELYCTKLKENEKNRIHMKGIIMEAHLKESKHFHIQHIHLWRPDSTMTLASGANPYIFVLVHACVGVHVC